MAAVDGYKRDDLTFRIIGAAMAVHSKLGAGLYEKIYENALCIEFTRREIRYERQKRFTVHYDGEDVGEMAADLVVEEEVIVKLKSVKELLPIHEAQLIAYLKAAKLKTGLLINFNERLLTSGIKRISVCINLGGLDKLGDLGGERFWCARRTRW
ncbi:MAG: GxxExxY protein [Chloroflexi bacterium]|nr:GxxExxY protein [Chloroflexota bacterium]